MFIDYEKFSIRLKHGLCFSLSSSAKLTTDTSTCLYENATMSGCLQDRYSKYIRLQRGVRQGDLIPPKVFTAALEEVFRLFDWNCYASTLMASVAPKIDSPMIQF